MKSFVAFLLLYFCAFIHSAEATTYWVAATGGTTTTNCVTASGTSDPGSYIRTIAAGIVCAGTSGTTQGAGDTVMVKAGTYAEALTSFPFGSGSGSEFTLKCETARACILAPSSSTDFAIDMGGQHGAWIIFDGFKITTGQGVVMCSASSAAWCQNLTFQNFEIDGTAMRFTAMGFQSSGDDNTILRDNYIHNLDGDSGLSHGIYISDYASNTKIYRNTIENNGAYCLQFFNGAGPSFSGVEIYNNIFNHCGTAAINGAGLVASTLDGALIYNNIAYNNIFQGLLIRHCNNCLVYNNTVYGNGLSAGGDGGGIIDDNNVTQSGTVCENNLAINNGTGGTVNVRNCATSDHNVTTGVASTYFTNAAGGDFTLKPSTDAIDTGLNLGSSYNRDFINTLRPQGSGWDIGAYESVVGCPAVTPLLVASYSFDDVTTNSSGTAVGSASLGTGVTYTTGQFNHGLTFTGVAGVTIADHDLLDLCAFTLEAWVSVPSVSSNSTFINKNPDSTYFLGQFATYCDASTMPMGGFGSVNACQAVALTTNTFTHLAVTYDGATITLYKNGVSVATTAVSTVLAATTGTLQFCDSSFSELCPSGTKLDEVRIYNYALTAPAIVSDMNTPIIPADVIPPEAPGSGALYLSWTDNASDETSQQIVRSPDFDGTYATLTSVAANVQTYRDTLLTAASQYCYKVRACNAGGCSAYSAAKCQRPTQLPGGEELASGFQTPVSSAGTATIVSGNAAPTNLVVRQ